MNFVIAEEIYKGIHISQFGKLKQERMKKAIAYARIRADWSLYDAEQKKAKDVLRTSAHNVFIDVCDILSRNMAEAGEDNSWRERLGVGRVGEPRKRIGDFACCLHAILGIQNR